MSKIPQGDWSAIAARYQNGESISKIARSYGCTPPAIHYILKRHRQAPAAAAGSPPLAISPTVNGSEHPISGARPSPVKRDLVTAAPALVRMHAPSAPPPSADQPVEPPRAAPPTPGLDSELYQRAEAAIEVFRMSFDAALIEGSPGVRERLRQAAADLMRVAARTTIVLDRLSARTERAAGAPNYPRSAHGQGLL